VSVAFLMQGGWVFLECATTCEWSSRLSTVLLRKLEDLIHFTRLIKDQSFDLVIPLVLCFNIDNAGENIAGNLGLVYGIDDVLPSVGFDDVSASLSGGIPIELA